MNTKTNMQLRLESLGPAKAEGQRAQQSPQPVGSMGKGAVDQKRKQLVTHDRLIELLEYNPDTGDFIWINGNQKAKAGTKAGNKNKCTGYIELMIDYKNYRAHRLAWFYAHKVWPKVIDHINRVKSDNRLLNLRDGNASLNAQNRVEAYPSSKSKILGVHFHSRHKLWEAKVTLNGRVAFRKYFKDINLAREAYLKAKKELHEFCTL